MGIQRFAVALFGQGEEVLRHAKARMVQWTVPLDKRISVDCPSQSQVLRPLHKALWPMAVELQIATLSPVLAPIDWADSLLSEKPSHLPECKHESTV